MNIVGVTGYLTRDASQAFTTSGVMKLIFDVMIDNERGAHIPWRCEIDQPHLITKYEEMLTAGRPFIIDAKLDGRPYEERGVTKGFTKFLRVLRAEFPERSKAKEETAETSNA